MTTSSSPQAQVTVCASLPLSVPVEYAGGANIDLHPSNWEWVPCLSLPITKLNTLHLSRKPYKWIKYAIGVVIGAHGELSTHSESNNIVDYNADLPTNSTYLSYHVSNEEKQMMFPLDPDILHTPVTSIASSNQRETFWVEVAARDGQQCIWTRISGRCCDAVHLLSHKTDQYISNFTCHCGRGDESNTITEIDDARNGLFLSANAHKIFGKEVAFLKTPNFAMQSDDVDETTEPNTRIYTAHIIEPDENQHMLSDHFSSSQLNIPDPVSPQFPPDILFDAVYAGMVLYHFGTKRMRDGISMKWKHHFYSNRPTTRANTDYMTILDESVAIAAKRECEVQECNARYEHLYGAHHNTFDFDLLAIPYLSVPPEELQAMVKAAGEEEEKVNATEQKRMRSRVEEWARQINTTKFF